jgi:hypothetical protein
MNNFTYNGAIYMPGVCCDTDSRATISNRKPLTPWNPASVFPTSRLRVKPFFPRRPRT